MIRILICPDKFKECLSSVQVANHIRHGVLNVFPEAEIRIIPLADGGEGTVEALTEAVGGRLQEAVVHDPLMRPVRAFYGILGDSQTAVIEMAKASGLALLRPAERNPMITTTYGTGELIRCALDAGCREIILGIGGSATVDGGVGMAQALGANFTDAVGNEIGPGGGNLGNIYHIDLTGLYPGIATCRITVACDVNNVLAGPAGAAFVFGPQKGAKPAMAKKLDDNLLHFSRVILEELGHDITCLPGGGAAGGLGAGVVVFLKGKLMPGFDVISSRINLESYVEWADLVITGEGKIDEQTAYGKTPSGVARLAGKKGKPVIAFTGAIGDNPASFRGLPFTTVIPIADRPLTREQSLENAAVLLENAAERTMQIMYFGKKVDSMVNKRKPASTH